MGGAINGDSIYNGAMDDGSGSALLLDMAISLIAGERADMSVSAAGRFQRQA